MTSILSRVGHSAARKVVSLSSRRQPQRAVVNNWAHQTLSRNLSSAAVEQPEPRRRRTLETRNPIVMVRTVRLKEESFWSRYILTSRLYDSHQILLFLSFFTCQTERAAERIKGLLAGDGAVGALGIRLGVRRRGCNGLSYTLNYAFEKPEKDSEMEAHGLKIFIEPMALFSVVGTTMDWEETELASEFTFNNPNSKGECGCGESFNV
jgi:iron-sulfur cluster assembly accessory protein